MPEKTCSTCQCNKVCDHNKYGFENCGNYISADVVPKSEVENLKVLLEVKEIAYEGLRELYHMDIDALVEARRKTEVEVAREIFEEMQSCLMIRHWHGNDILTFEFDAVKYAELKKKYTEEGK